MKAILITPTGKEELDLNTVKSIQSVAQSQVIIVKQTRETVTGLRVEFE